MRMRKIYVQIYSPIDDLRLIIIMEYQKIRNLSNNTLNQPNLGQKIGLK